MSTSYLLYLQKYFHYTLVKCSSQWDGMQNPWFSCTDSWSRSQLKVMEFTLEFHVHSISPLPPEGFSLHIGQMFISVRWHAEPMIQLRRLLVKVTVKGHGIYFWILCLLHISLTLEGFSLNLGQMLISVRWCTGPMTQLHRLKVKVTV